MDQGDSNTVHPPLPPNLPTHSHLIRVCIHLFTLLSEIQTQQSLIQHRSHCVYLMEWFYNFQKSSNIKGYCVLSDYMQKIQYRNLTRVAELGIKIAYYKTKKHIYSLLRRSYVGNSFTYTYNSYALYHSCYYYILRTAHTIRIIKTRISHLSST